MHSFIKDGKVHPCPEAAKQNQIMILPSLGFTDRIMFLGYRSSPNIMVLIQDSFKFYFGVICPQNILHTCLLADPCGLKTTGNECYYFELHFLCIYITGDYLGLDSDALTNTVVRTATYSQNYILYNAGDVVTGTGNSPTSILTFV